MKREEIAVRQFDLHPKLFADKDIFFPSRKTPADADLFEPRVLFFAILGIDDCRNIERKSNVLSLVDRHAG
jgi:hypothetical protein